ncbi:hypothetical protein Asp14428_33500 [Actinoplanes sp. NBRC 14428]|nr:hypothetical protein Asp14428_33500 [Actinoplanes sp. NBRC 14428]
MSADVIDPTYLPFSTDQLRRHFCEVRGGEKQDADRHLKYYLDSAAAAADYKALVRSGGTPTQSQLKRGRQMEKDERFWLVAALMNLFHEKGELDRASMFGDLMTRAGVDPPKAFGSWQEAFAGGLALCFEANLPSPPTYRGWLQSHLRERVLVPYLHEAAIRAGSRVEGATKLDAMLVAQETGVAVAFEAKVLSDASCSITNDVLRNQIARIIDTLLDKNHDLMPPLSRRNPQYSYCVLVTPEIFRHESEDDFLGGRLYSWLMRAYRDPGNTLLGKHLPHRNVNQLADVPARIGWATWDDMNLVLPNSCPWLM